MAEEKKRIDLNLDGWTGVFTTEDDECVGIFKWLDVAEKTFATEIAHGHVRLWTVSHNLKKD